MTDPKTPPGFPPRAYLRPDHSLGFSRNDAVEFIALQEHEHLLQKERDDGFLAGLEKALCDGYEANEILKEAQSAKERME